jgi:hypothetical protein
METGDTSYNTEITTELLYEIVIQSQCGISKQEETHKNNVLASIHTHSQCAISKQEET